jgi:hypothetical protein
MLLAHMTNGRYVAFAIMIVASITACWLARRMMFRAKDAGNRYWWLGSTVYLHYARGAEETSLR